MTTHRLILAIHTSDFPSKPQRPKTFHPPASKGKIETHKAAHFFPSLYDSVKYAARAPRTRAVIARETEKKGKRQKICIARLSVKNRRWGRRPGRAPLSRDVRLKCDVSPSRGGARAALLKRASALYIYIYKEEIPRFLGCRRKARNISVNRGELFGVLRREMPPPPSRLSLHFRFRRVAGMSRAVAVNIDSLLDPARSFGMGIEC